MARNFDTSIHNLINRTLNDFFEPLPDEQKPYRVEFDSVTNATKKRDGSVGETVIQRAKHQLAELVKFDPSKHEGVETYDIKGKPFVIQVRDVTSFLTRQRLDGAIDVLQHDPAIIKAVEAKAAEEAERAAREAANDIRANLEALTNLSDDERAQFEMMLDKATK